MNVTDVDLSTVPATLRLTDGGVRTAINEVQKTTMRSLREIRDEMVARREAALRLVAEDVRNLETRLDILGTDPGASANLATIRGAIEQNETWAAVDLTDILSDLSRTGRSSPIVQSAALLVLDDVTFLVHSNQCVEYLEKLTR